MPKVLSAGVGCELTAVANITKIVFKFDQTDRKKGV